MTPFEVLYERLYGSPVCWMEPGERKDTEPSLLRETTYQIQMIRNDWQQQRVDKIVVDKRMRLLTFSEENYVFLMISPCKGIARF